MNARSFRRAAATCALASAAIGAAHPTHAAGTLTVSSADFATNAPIPLVHEGNALGCTGANQPLILAWGGAPSRTRSFALTMVDYTAPVPGRFVHWLVTSIPANRTEIDPATLAGTVQGENSAGGTGYFGPCPPAGQLHDYTITLYALNVDLHSPSMKLAAFESAIKNHVLGQASIVGTFQR